MPTPPPRRCGDAQPRLRFRRDLDAVFVNSDVMAVAVLEVAPGRAASAR